MHPPCSLCSTPGGEVLLRTHLVRVVLPRDLDHPALCRVIWNTHVQEMTDLDAPSRSHLMDTVFRTESALRALLTPTKINLASLGNLVPHLHWHVIPRFPTDPHFPHSIWTTPLRSRTQSPLTEAQVAKLTKSLQPS